MSFLKQITDAIGRIERTIGLKTDIDNGTIFARLNKLENINNDDILLHKNELGDVTVPSGYNMIISNPVSFNSLTIEDNASVIIL